MINHAKKRTIAQNYRNGQGIITVNEIINKLNVSDMTIRRDLDELDKAGKVVRIHGGAQSISYSINQELSHSEKQTLQIEEKRKIVELASTYINDGDTIFLGPGTTIELLAHFLINKRIRIVTNNYPAFEILKQSDSVNIILTGGDFRKNTGALVGPITNANLKRINFTKSFISANGIHNESICTYNIEEGEAQEIALNNSRTKYLLLDNKKLNKDDFYVFYNLHDIDYLITDHSINKDVKIHYEQYVNIIVT